MAIANAVKRSRSMCCKMTTGSVLSACTTSFSTTQLVAKLQPSMRQGKLDKPQACPRELGRINSGWPQNYESKREEGPVQQRFAIELRITQEDGNWSRMQMFETLYSSGCTEALPLWPQELFAGTILRGYPGGKFPVSLKRQKMRFAQPCLRLISFSLMFWICSPGLPQQTTQVAKSNKAALSNQDILAMVKVQFPDATIIKTIQVNETDFDLSAGALVTLKSAGVGQTVIDAMLAAGTNKKKEGVSQTGQMSVESLGTRTTDLLGEVGVYVMQGSKLTAVEPEIVNWRTGGVIKTLATAGLDKGHVNGTVSGPTSRLSLASPPQLMPDTTVFYFHCLEGTSAAEYQLLRLWGKGDRREFRAVTGGILHASGGAKDNVVEFKYEKVSPRIYKVSVPRLNIGEYGFLAPGAVATANAASQGKIYTFRIVE